MSVDIISQLISWALLNFVILSLTLMPKLINKINFLSTTLIIEFQNVLENFQSCHGNSSKITTCHLSGRFAESFKIVNKV